MKTKSRINKNGVTEKKCIMCGEWKPETDEYYYKYKRSGKFMDDCKICSAPYQKYRVKKEKAEKAPLKNDKSALTISDKISVKGQSKRHTYKMNIDTMEKIDILNSVTGIVKGEIISNAVNFLIENNKKYRSIISEYRKLINKFRD